MRMYNVFIDGREGTTGLRIYERLSAFADISLLTLSEKQRKDPAARQACIRQSDIAFLCLPDDAAREAVKLAGSSSVRIIDASTAHRTVPGWSYGFPELSAAHAQAIATGSRIAVPGCHASGFIALVYPLIASGILGTDALLSCFSITGYSGGGKKMIAEYQSGERGTAYSSPRHYATAQAHKHLQEMQKVTGLAYTPIFNPVVADFYAGMLVSVPLHAGMLNKRLQPEALQAIYAMHYAGKSMVNVLPYSGENEFLAANALSGKDTMEIMIAGRDDRFTLMARYDNLGKGASGAAIQCMNLMLGRAETAGLTL